MRTQAKMLATLGLSLLLPVASNAGTITFFDFTDTVSVLDTTSRSDLPASCASPEVCFGTLTAPNGSAAVTIDVTGLNILEPPGSPSAGLVSDVLFLSLNQSTHTIQVSFSSDTEGLIMDPIPGGRIFEDGTIQTASMITWLNANGSINTIDTIRFQSDLEAPEPSSILLLPPLFAALGIWKHRRK